MLPTSCVERSYFSFSGAFMALVYPPHSLCEIGVVRGDQLRDRPAQQFKILFRWYRRQRDFLRRIEVEPCFAAEVALLVDAFQAEALLVPLPGEERLAGE